MLLGQTALSGTGGQRIGVTSISWNPAFSPELLGSDVALVRLARAPARAGRTRRPDRPGARRAPAPARPARAARLGHHAPRRRPRRSCPTSLRTAVLTILDDPTCAAKAGFPYAGATDALRDGRHLRAASPCFGDSGGRSWSATAAAPAASPASPAGASCAGRRSRRASSPTCSRCARGSTRHRRPRRSAPAASTSAAARRVGRSIHCVAQVTGATGIAVRVDARAGVPIVERPELPGAARPTPGRPWRAPSRRATPAAASRGLAAGRDRRRPRRRPPRAHARAARHPLHPAARRRRASARIRVTRRRPQRIADVAFLVAADDKPLRLGPRRVRERRACGRPTCRPRRATRWSPGPSTRPGTSPAPRTANISLG